MNNSPMTKAAQELINEFKSPVNLSYFLGDAVNWVNDYHKNKPSEEIKYDPFVMLGFYIQDVLPAWYAGGKNVIKNVADSLIVIAGMDQYYEEICEIISAYGYHGQMEIQNSCAVERVMVQLKTLFKLGVYFSEYEKQQEKSKDMAA